MFKSKNSRGIGVYIPQFLVPRQPCILGYLCKNADAARLYLLALRPRSRAESGYEGYPCYSTPGRGKWTNISKPRF